MERNESPPLENTGNEKEKKPRPRSPKTGAELPIGRPFVQGSEQRERARLAGIRSGEARRERKTLRQELLDLLSVTSKDANGVEHTRNEAISVALIRQAQEGNVKAFETIRDTIGEKQRETVEMSVALPQFENLDAAFRKLGGGE